MKHHWGWEFTPMTVIFHGTSVWARSLKVRFSGCVCAQEGNMNYVSWILSAPSVLSIPRLRVDFLPGP